MGNRPLRHANAETIALMKKLNVMPSFSAFPTGGFESRLWQYGADRVNEILAVKTFIQEGFLPTAELAATARNSPGEGRSALANIEAYVTRKAGEDNRVFGANEKLDRMEALYMVTKWAARRSAEEDLLGTIEPGKLADLVVLGGDFLTVPEDQIYEQLPVLTTIVGGKIVYQAD